MDIVTPCISKNPFFFYFDEYWFKQYFVFIDFKMKTVWLFFFLIFQKL